MFVLLLLGLIAAGIFTHAAIWFIIAGILGGIWFLTVLVALAGARAAFKRIDKDFERHWNRWF